ncbi:MAG: hypothetical protein WHX93_11535 [bacterium]
MDLKLITILQLAFDLVAGGLILLCVFKASNSSRNFSRMHEDLLKEIDSRTAEFQDIAKGLMEGMDSRIQRLKEAAEELDRAEIRACETLEKLHKAQEENPIPESSYEVALRWLRQGLSVEEVARKSGLGLGELQLMQHLGSKGRAQA